MVMWVVCLLMSLYKSTTSRNNSQKYIIPAMPLYNRDIVSIYFNHFHCMKICDTLMRHLCMLTYIHLNVGECLLTSSMPVQRF